jgi:hypothetical protein
MSMQIVVGIIVMLLISSPVAAAECKTELTGLVVYFSSHDDDWSISWKADGVHKDKIAYYINRKDGIRTNVYHSAGDERARRLPQALLSTDNQFNIPFDISRESKLLIAAIYDKSDMDHPSTKFAIVDIVKQRIVRTVDSEYSVRSLAWAPDDRHFAVLGYQIVTEQVIKGPLDWLASFVGHSISYYTFYLTIYKPDGTSVCTAQVAKKLPDAMSYIDWEKQ